MTFAKKLYLLIAIAVFGLVAIGVFGIVQINSVYTAANYANENSLPSIEQIDDATEAMFRMRIAVWKHIASTDVEGKKSSMEEISKRQRAIATALENYEKENLSDDADRQLLAKDRAALQDYYVERDRVLALSAAGNFEEARRMQLSIQAPIKQADEALAKHRAYNVNLATEGATRAAATRQHATLLSGVIALVITATVTAAGTVLVRRLVFALREAVELANAVSGGDLSRRVAATGNDEISQLQQALSQMSSKLTEIIGEVQSSAIAIQTASTEIASGNMDLSARTEQQAGALEETASSMEELTSTVQHNADNSNQARQLAGEAAETAKRGGQVVAQVVDTMAAISDASHQIVDIISVIDGIAFQTNILALNAAVEAARAGEQGRGFAVVATEVRNLAHRSAAAAKEIKSLIDNASDQVQQGGVLVEQAGTAMQRIVTSVQRVADVIGEISEAGREQSAGIQQINQAVTQMDDMTQQNAALVEQSAAAAVAMRDQADTLTKLVGHFRLQSTTQRTIKTSRELNVSTARLALART
jgi:methyl-accepting chemotaxis protein